MKKTLSTLAGGLAAVALMTAVNARASFVDIGPPVETGSWTQGIGESGVGLFNRITGTMVTGLFDWPTSAGFTDSGWTANPANSATFAGISRATKVSSTTFVAHFAGAKTSPVSLYLYAWNDSTLVDKALASWSGSAWTFTALPVPEPTTMIAGALLLLPFGMSTIRMLRRSRMLNS